ncbi:MAG: hypothetical protein IJ107_05590, partial [Lachnospiraceae bacterium]|nr:hypothetical protein [Lachnospiraceae bacterium]
GDPLPPPSKICCSSPPAEAGDFPAELNRLHKHILHEPCQKGYIRKTIWFILKQAPAMESSALSMEEAFRLAYYTMEHGTRPALQIQIGKLED